MRFLTSLVIVFVLIGSSFGGEILPALSDESKDCIECHKIDNPGLYGHWGSSKHFGANVGCYECHAADKKDVDAMEHNGFTISIIVSPDDCAKCHEQESREFQASHHAAAGKILGSLDNVLGEVVEGPALAVLGCKQCHGSEIKVLEGGKLDPATWPNTGMGRLNPDGSRGSCSACHSRHAFSVEQARQPENCGKCHLGPDHPQKEIYEESKHGIAYYGYKDKMNLENSKWVVGEDYWAAPTCATCHMSATADLPITHEIGDRISWTLRPPVSQMVDAKAIKAGKKVKSWQDRRADMQSVCKSCHGIDFIQAHYTQYDNLIHLYNDKFAKPGLSIIKLLKKEKLLTPTAFDEEIEWVWFYLWHHEGRRARMGAAMFAPDYTHWHGLYEVAERFYLELIPEAREIAHAAGNKKVDPLIDEILNRDEHKWFLGKMSKKEAKRRKKAQEEFKKRYAE